MQSLVARGGEENGVGVRPRGIEFAVSGIHCQCRKDVVQRGEQGSVIDESGRPSFATVGAARDKDIVEVGAGSLLDTGFTGGVDVVNIMGDRIGDNRPLVVVEGRIAGGTTLSRDGRVHTSPSEAIVIGALHVN